MMIKAIVATVMLLSTVAAIVASATTAVHRVQAPPPTAVPELPIPDIDIPSSLHLSDKRVDVHGWLFLPWDCTFVDASGRVNSSACLPLAGYYYHHTPELYVVCL
jgi:hypothetical protein